MAGFSKPPNLKAPKISKRESSKTPNPTSNKSAPPSSLHVSSHRVANADVPKARGPIQLPVVGHGNEEAERDATCSDRVPFVGRISLLPPDGKTFDDSVSINDTSPPSRGHDRSSFLFLIHCPEYVATEGTRKPDRGGDRILLPFLPPFEPFPSTRGTPWILEINNPFSVRDGIYFSFVRKGGRSLYPSTIDTRDRIL